MLSSMPSTRLARPALKGQLVQLVSFHGARMYRLYRFVSKQGNATLG